MRKRNSKEIKYTIIRGKNTNTSKRHLKQSES